MRTPPPCPPIPRAPDDGQIRSTVDLLLAVAHPVRLRVLLELGASDARSVGELQQLLGVEQSALSHQLRTLREARLVVGERAGKRVLYRLVDDHVAHIIADAMTHAVEHDGDRAAR